MVTTKCIVHQYMACVHAQAEECQNMHTHRRTCARAGSAVRRGCGFLHRHMFAGETPGHLAFAFLCSGALVRAWALVTVCKCDCCKCKCDSCKRDCWGLLEHENVRLGLSAHTCIREKKNHHPATDPSCPSLCSRPSNASFQTMPSLIGAASAGHGNLLQSR